MNNDTMDPNFFPALPDGFVVRSMTIADLGAVVEFVNTCKKAMQDGRFLTLDDARRLFQYPGFKLEHSTRLILSPEEDIVGHGAVWDVAAIPVHVHTQVFVHPEYEDLGLRGFLLAWAEERARQALTRVPKDVRAALFVDTISTYQPAKKVYEQRGMKLARHFWLMRIKLNQSPPESQWPDGIRICTYQDYPDLRAICLACDEAFQDHWGFVKQPEEDILKRWQQWVNDTNFDPLLLFVAMDGEHIAAVEFCKPSVWGDTHKGVVFALGVRRPWRRKGLALALLHHAFGEFYRRGKQQVWLDVDSGNLTGATRLYEKAGMRAEWQIDVYEEKLRH